MTATCINPADYPVTFDPAWHKHGSEVTLSAVQIFAAYHALRLARKGEKQPKICRDSVKFLNATFAQKFSAEKWFYCLSEVVIMIRQKLV